MMDPSLKDAPTEAETSESEDESKVEETLKEVEKEVQPSAALYGYSSVEPRDFATVGQEISRRGSSLVRRSSSIVAENLPETPSGWAKLITFLGTCALGYEIRLQKSLTCPPLVYIQPTSKEMKAIYDEMTKNPDSLLLRDIQPSLFVGTRAHVASTAAYLLGGPARKRELHRFREVLTMPMDGGVVAIDWELPVGTTREEVEEGKIKQPIVVVIHGLNNDANFGYIRSMMRACTEKGWIAAGFNMRGCGGVNLATPRGYNGCFTGDIRFVVKILSARLVDRTPLFLVGNSLSASLVTKYLGEEGLSGTLPECVAGGAALGNPSFLDSNKINMLYSPLIALGAKKAILSHWASLLKVKDPHFLGCIRRSLLSPTMAKFDESVCPILIRNDPTYPFAFRIGFKDGLSYWNDGSSYRLVRFVSVPLLQLVASDDFLVYHTFKGRVNYYLSNPNVIVIESKCGGHLGWQEAPPGNYGLGKSWADSATTDFISSVFKAHANKKSSKRKVDVDSYFSKERDHLMTTREAGIKSRL